MKSRIRRVGDFPPGHPYYYEEYEVYVKHWYWPFWSLIGITGTADDAQTILEEYK